METLSVSRIREEPSCTYHRRPVCRTGRARRRAGTGRAGADLHRRGRQPRSRRLRPVWPRPSGLPGLPPGHARHRADAGRPALGARRRAAAAGPAVEHGDRDLTAGRLTPDTPVVLRHDDVARGRRRRVPVERVTTRRGGRGPFRSPGARYRANRPASASLPCPLWMDKGTTESAAMRNCSGDRRRFLATLVAQSSSIVLS